MLKEKPANVITEHVRLISVTLKVVEMQSKALWHAAIKQWLNKTPKYKLVEYKCNIPTHNLTNPGFNLISKVINPVSITNCFEGKNLSFIAKSWS